MQSTEVAVTAGEFRFMWQYNSKLTLKSGCSVVDCSAQIIQYQFDSLAKIETTDSKIVLKSNLKLRN